MRSTSQKCHCDIVLFIPKAVLTSEVGNYTIQIINKSSHNRKMTSNQKISPWFDGIGLASLVISIFALAGSVWFIDVVVQGKLIEAFSVSFAISVGCFLAARLVQIVNVIRTTPDPKSLRVVAANEATSLDVGQSSVVQDIRHAA